MSENENGPRLSRAVNSLLGGLLVAGYIQLHSIN